MRDHTMRDHAMPASNSWEANCRVVLVDPADAIAAARIGWSPVSQLTGLSAHRSLSSPVSQLTGRGTTRIASRN
jgi:hypothetical protein